jgi:hypothetical protein
MSNKGGVTCLNDSTFRGNAIECEYGCGSWIVLEPRGFADPSSKDPGSHYIVAKDGSPIATFSGPWNVATVYARCILHLGRTCRARPRVKNR